MFEKSKCNQSVNLYRGCSIKNFDKDSILPVILSEAKNLLFPQFLKEEILRTKMQYDKKGRLTKILEQPQSLRTQTIQ